MGVPSDVERRVEELEAENRRLRELYAEERQGLQGLVARLRSSEERFSKSFQASPDSINLNRLSDGIYLAVNRGFTELTGWTEPEVLGRSSLEIDIWAAPEDRMRLVRGLRERGAVDELAASFRLKDGTVRPGRMWARVIEVQGEACILSITRDVSAAQTAQEALRRSEEKLRETIELAADGITFVDRDGVVLSVNRTGLELIGARAEEVIGHHLSEFIDAGSLAQTPPRVERLDRGETLVSERDFLRRDGTRVPVEMCTRRMPDGTYQSVLRDLTERRRVEQERAELQRRLDQAARLEAIGRLAAGLAHDFNNLLTPMMAAASLAARDATASPKVRRALQTVLDAAERAAQLTRQILALGRKQVLRLQPVDVNGVVCEAERMLRRVIGEEVGMELALAEPLPPALADAGQVHQVVLNLALNARDAMPRGGLLRVSTSLFEPDATAAARVTGLSPGRFVRVDVADTGAGMDEQTLARVFEPFFTTKELGRGTGLGLATARGITEQHGGALWGASTAGSGSVFSACFPVAEEQPAVAAPPATEPGGPAGGRVLLVEDEPLVRAVARRVLEDAGCTVVAASGADDALRAAAEMDEPPDVLVTDVVMPGRSGHELHAELLRRWPELPVLYVSGYPDDVLAPRGLLAPGTPMLAKPFTAEALVKAVRGVRPRR